MQFEHECECRFSSIFLFHRSPLLGLSDAAGKQISLKFQLYHFSLWFLNSNRQDVMASTKPFSLSSKIKRTHYERNQGKELACYGHGLEAHCTSLSGVRPFFLLDSFASLYWRLVPRFSIANKPRKGICDCECGHECHSTTLFSMTLIAFSWSVCCIWKCGWQGQPSSRALQKECLLPFTARLSSKGNENDTRLLGSFPLPVKISQGAFDTMQ